MKADLNLLCTGALLVSLASCHFVFAEDTGAPVSEPVASDVNKRLDKIERLLQSQGLLDMLQLIEQLQTQVSKMRGEIEVQTNTIEQLKKQQRDIYSDIDNRLQRIESGEAKTASTSVTPPLQTLETSDSVASDSGEQTTNEPAIQVETISNDLKQDTSPETQVVENQTESAATDQAATPASEVDPAKVQAEYQRAFKLLREAQYTQAVNAFNEFLSSYPDSQYSDNAQYWLGEANYVMQQYQKAIGEYEKLLSTYPKSQKVAHALLKIGYSYHELGNLKEAHRRLKDLTEKYPGTTAARLAEDRLRQIDLTVQ